MIPAMRAAAWAADPRRCISAYDPAHDPAGAVAAAGVEFALAGVPAG
jgi:hypothetical protein